ncbi:hypothetical protein GCK32_021674, partial [Trichostrongylus colubriformis]
VLIFPAACTIVALDDEQLEVARFWMEYWIAYGVITTLGRAVRRHATDSSEMSWVEVMFFSACLIPATFLVDIVISCVRPAFNNVRLKFEEYNYRYVS